MGAEHRASVIPNVSRAARAGALVFGASADGWYGSLGPREQAEAMRRLGLLDVRFARPRAALRRELGEPHTAFVIRERSREVREAEREGDER